jgi:hypothetical protein
MSHKTTNKNQTKTNKKRTQYALDTIIRKQTQITLIRHEPLTNNVDVKNEPTIVCMRKSQHGTQSVMTHNRRTQNTTKMSNMDLNDRYIFVKALHLRVQSVFINIDSNLTALFNQIKTNLKKC